MRITFDLPDLEVDQQGKEQDKDKGNAQSLPAITQLVESRFASPSMPNPLAKCLSICRREVVGTGRFINISGVSVGAASAAVRAG